MHVYLIITRDYKNAFVFTNIQKAKDKEKEIDGIAYEWMELWCRPLKYDSRNQKDEIEFDDSALPWEMLKLAYQQGNWNARAKYREELFNNKIKKLCKIE